MNQLLIKIGIYSIIILLLLSPIVNSIEHEKDIDYKIKKFKIQQLLNSAKHSQDYQLNIFDCRHTCVETEIFLEAHGYNTKIAYIETWFSLPEYGHVWILIYLDNDIYPIESAYNESMGFIVQEDWDFYKHYLIYETIYEDAEEMAAEWL